jgi:transposase
MRSSAKDQVHAVLAKLGIPVPCSDLFGAFGVTWLDGLKPPQPYAGKVTSLRQLIGWLTAEAGMLDEVIADFLGGWPPYQAVLRLPGIGPVLAAVVIAEIGDVSRFPGPGQLRLGRADAAAPRVRRQGRPRAHHQAGLPGPAVGDGRGHRHQPAGSPPRELKDAITLRRGSEAKNIAKVAAARKLLTCVLCAMRDGEVRSLAGRSRAAQAG